MHLLFFSFLATLLYFGEAATSHHLNRLPRSSFHHRNLTRRFDNSRFTFYEAGLGACGETNKGSDFIVALNSAQWDGGSHCREQITITVKGKTTQATIMDQCPGCPFGGLDFTEGLFTFFASKDEGVVTGSWNFGSGGGKQDEPKTTSTKKEDAPKTTSKTEEPPKTTQEAPKTTSTSSSSSSSTTSTTTTSASSSSSVASASSTASSASVAGAAATATDGIGGLNQVILDLAQMQVHLVGS